MEKKNDYISPEVEIILLELSDIVTTSQPDGEFDDDDTDW